MNILNKLTLANLKKNRTRTLVTIIGVILSVAMVTAVTTSIVSLQDHMVKNTISSTGNWQVRFINVQKKEVDTIRQDEDVENTFTTKLFGYSPLKNEGKYENPFLAIEGYSKQAFKELPYTLSQGELPKDETEILLPINYQTTLKEPYKIGDIVTFKLGQESIIKDDETFEAVAADTYSTTEEQTYKVVGFIEWGIEKLYSEPSYFAATGLTDTQTAVTQYVALKNPKDVYTFSKKYEALTYQHNRSLLQSLGITGNDSFRKMTFYLGVILILLIGTGSVLLINNSFAISINERLKQFGVLASVGATKKQLRTSVLFEGTIIGSIGIPLGLFSGFFGLWVTFKLLEDKLNVFGNINPLTLQFSWQAIVLSILISILTIYISAYLPARKALKKSIISSIRQSEQIKLSGKKVRTPKFIQKLFGLEATIALKNFKRNKRAYRSTIASLFVSIVLFISTASFSMYLISGVNQSVELSEADVTYTSYGELNTETATELFERASKLPEVEAAAWQQTAHFTVDLSKQKLSKDYSDYLKSQDTNYKEDPASSSLVVQLIDKQTFKSYLKELGLSEADYFRSDNPKILAIQTINMYDSTARRMVNFDMFDSKEPLTVEMLRMTDTGTETTGKTLTLSTYAAHGPKLLSSSYSYGLTAILPEDQAALLPTAQNYDYFNFSFKAADSKLLVENLASLLQQMNLPVDRSLTDVASYQETDKNMVFIINVFSYGFIILMTLITIANVFNTISTSIQLRRRELAMLESVGMTEKSINKMMRFECLYYGFKSLLYGLPVAFAITYLIYTSVAVAIDQSFRLPTTSVLISILSVFLIVFITMLYSVHKLRKMNLIDSLRTETV
ncbi:FtsX-like permease family protein [uncultured Enterococcus sp.]|uniref:FtsX-like permease family protein n=1 Tax=uncultured Enterococcus sp. TaxID=167972 RepID=UPI002AA617F4|nr:FtsX-like permease family protein [uncultured Enterococcus sp.]